MTYAVTSGCINCKFSDCVDVCPTDSFHEGPNMLAINPNDCIDCGLCEPVCPENAIFADTELPEHESDALNINAQLVSLWPVIYKSKAPMPGAEKWQGIADKWPLLIAEPGSDPTAGMAIAGASEPVTIL